MLKKGKDIDVVSSLDELHALKNKFPREIQAEEVGGKNILIHHPTNTSLRSRGSYAVELLLVM